MNFLGIGAGELVLIVAIILLVVGPERLPQLARQWAKFAKTIAQFTRTWQQFNAELNRQLNLDELTNPQPRPAAKTAPAPLPSAPGPDENENSIAPPELAQLDSNGSPEPDAGSSVSAGEAPAAADGANAEEQQHGR